MSKACSSASGLTFFNLDVSWFARVADPRRTGNAARGHESRFRSGHTSRAVTRRGVSEKRMTMSTPVKYLGVFAVLLLPSSAFAQATLTGTVRDPAGAALPGVTVEA